MLQCCNEDKEVAYQMAFSLYDLHDIKLCHTVSNAFPNETEGVFHNMKQILAGKISKDLYSLYRPLNL